MSDAVARLANPGKRSESGDIAVTRGSGLPGNNRCYGLFAGYAIDGMHDAIVNTAVGMARGILAVVGRTGASAGCRGSGTIEGTVVASGTLGGIGPR